MSKSEGAKHWIDKNLWAILAVGLGLYTGYLTGQTTMEARIAALEKKAERHNDQLTDRRQFMSCAVRTLDRLQDATGTPQVCPLEITE